MANDLLRGRQVVLPMTNKSGGDLNEGDTVILSSADASAFTTTTTTAQSDDLVGVLIEDIANNATGRVCVVGYVPKINLSGSASLGDYVQTHTVAGQASRTGTKAAGAFGQVLGTGTTPAAILWGVPFQAVTGGSPVVTDITAQILIYDDTKASTGAWDVADAQLIAGNAYADFDDLIVEVLGRSDAAVTADAAYIFFNNDTTLTNYKEIRNGVGNATDNNAFTDNTESIIPGANSVASAFGVMRYYIPDYNNTNRLKKVIGQYLNRRDANNMDLSQVGFEWENAAAISRIQVQMDNHPTNGFVQYSRLRIWGVKQQQVVVSV